MQEVIKRDTQRISKALDKFIPISQTLSPKGKNSGVQKSDKSVKMTNDGDFLRRHIKGDDEFEEAIISICSKSADRIHSEVGDARSSTLTMNMFFGKEVLKLIDNGYGHREIATHLNLFKEKYIEEIRKFKIKFNKKDLFHVAKISANNDEDIAKNTMESINVVGEHGLIFMDVNKSGNETIVEKELGFNVKGGVKFKELLLDQNVFHVAYNDVPVLITDKRLYYRDEAESILSVIKQAGYKSVVIVCREVIKGSDAEISLIENHNHNDLKVCIIEDPNVTDTENETLYDLATYMNGKVITDKAGDLVNDITIKDFSIAKKVFQDVDKALITPKIKGNKVAARIKSIQEAIKKSKKDKDEKLERRLASLTSGNVNLFIGGSTTNEVDEKIDRYKDAINAVRRAMNDGYVVGGGVTLLKAFKPEFIIPEYEHVLRRYSETIIRQIAENCNEHQDTVVNKVKSGKKNFGYNALTGKFEDLFKAGVLEPLRSLELIVDISISFAIQLASVETWFINKEEEKKEDK